MPHAETVELKQVDIQALEYMSGKLLPAQFLCHRNPETILSTACRKDLQARAKGLGVSETSTLSQVILGITTALVKGGAKVPEKFKALSHVQRSLQQGQQHVTCWKCGCEAEIRLENVSDLQVGSWPPGDARRWQQGRSCVVPCLVCPGTGSDDHPLVVREGFKDEDDRHLSPQTRKLLIQSNTSRTRQLYCRVGQFRTIVGVLWQDQWRSLDEVLQLLRPQGLEDGLIEVPMEPSIERVCLQILNWFSMSGEEKQDKNCLPARVYLTREAKLVCRNARVVGFVTYNSTPSKDFRLPSLNAIYVIPGARKKGACREMVYSVFRPDETRTVDEKGKSGTGNQHASQQNKISSEPSKEDKKSLDGEHLHEEPNKVQQGVDAAAVVLEYGIEVPISKAFLETLPKMLTVNEMKHIRVVEHGDSLEVARSRPTVWFEVCKTL